jgi:hypothetical protein
MKQIWKVTDIENAKYIGILEVNEESFEIFKTKEKLVFGSFCNAGFIESGFMEIEEYESTDEALQELLSDLETYYQDGAQYVSRIIVNERM